MAESIWPGEDVDGLKVLMVWNILKCIHPQHPKVELHSEFLSIQTIHQGMTQVKSALFLSSHVEFRP